MENKYIEKMRDLIDQYNIQLINYKSGVPIRFYALQNNSISYSNGDIISTKPMIWIPENTRQSALEQAWCVAHELGHAMLEHHLSNKGDRVQRERDAWNKAEMILLSHNIPLQAPTGEWVLSESFYVEKKWALGTYENAERKRKMSKSLGIDVPADSFVDSKPISYVRYIWIRLKQILRVLLKSACSGFAVIGLLFIMDASRMYQLVCAPDGIRSVVLPAVIVYPAIYISLYVMAGVLKKSEERE